MAASLLLAGAPLLAAFLFEIDIDGLDDGPITYNSRFSFGGDTTTASTSAASQAVGTTGADSIFGGDGSALPDTYVYNYAPGSEADNYFPLAGTDLGEGHTATGATGGGAGYYAVYATWPFSSNVSGGLTHYNVSTPGDGFEVLINQNDASSLGGTAGRGDVWVLLGHLEYSSGDITVRQSATTNSFISQRAYGLLFELVPDAIFIDSFETGDESRWSNFAPT